MNLIGQENAGYVITDQVKSSMVDYVVIAQKPNKNEYVVWRTCGYSKGFYWGSYVSSREQAVEIMVKRLQKLNS